MGNYYRYLKKNQVAPEGDDHQPGEVSLQLFQAALNNNNNNNDTNIAPVERDDMIDSAVLSAQPEYLGKAENLQEESIFKPSIYKAEKCVEDKPPSYQSIVSLPPVICATETKLNEQKKVKDMLLTIK